VQLQFSRHNFEKKNIYFEFRENPSIASRVFPCEQSDMTKLIVVRLKFAKATNKIVLKREFITEPKRCTVCVVQPVFLEYVYNYLISWLCDPNCEIINAQIIFVGNPLLNAVT
jgi:hypothetical protein